MVACRITDARSIASKRAGANSSGQVPSKKYKQARVSSITTILIAILHWIWPPDRCTNCHSIYSTQINDESSGGPSMVGQIHRSVDGRFVLSNSNVLTADRSKMNATTTTTVPGDDRICGDETGASTAERRNSVDSQNSSSDDGGFLSRQHTINTRASWRRPLVASSSHLSLQSVATNSNKGESGGGGFIQSLGGLLRVGRGGTGSGGARYQNICKNPLGYDNIYRDFQPQSGSRPFHHNLHINTVSVGGSSVRGAGATTPHLNRPSTPNLYTTSKSSHIFSGSPASGVGGGCLTSPWIANSHHHHLSDLHSSGHHPESNERPFLGSANRSRYYSHELPSLRTIQEETRRMSQQQLGFIPLDIPSPPSWRNYYHTQTPYHSYRPRTRWYPRHYSRLLARSQSEMMSPLPHLNLTSRSVGTGGFSSAMGLEASPESRSSSSGFGSKNTSNQHHGSHHSGSTSEWRLLPPYRPPPPPSSSVSYFHPTNSLPLPANNRQQAQAQQISYPHHCYHQGNYLQQRRLSRHLLDLPQPTTYQPVVSPYYDHHPHPLYPNTNNTMSNYYSGSGLNHPSTPPYTMSNWLEIISRLNAATDTVNLHKGAIDVGSVDGHYEFDPSSPTPSASTPTGGPRDDLNSFVENGHHLHQHHHPNHNYHQLHQHHALDGGADVIVSGTGVGSNGIFHTTTSGMPMTMSQLSSVVGGHLRKTRVSRYDNIDVRLQAMKEEFYAYRKRQAMKRAGVVELESMC